MKMSSNEGGFLLVAGALAVLVGWIGYCRNNSNTAPAQEIAATSLNAQLDRLTEKGFFHPHDFIEGQGMMFTQLRYPNVTGGNISTLIHHGMDRLNQPAPQDGDWIIRPPGEVMWL